MRRLLAAATVLGLVFGSAAGAAAATAAPATSDATSSFAAKPIAWGACKPLTGTDRLDKAGAQCGYLTVPLDYHKPKGATVQIAVSRIKHKVPASKYQGIMLVNPGGPGGSGLGLSVLGGYVPNHAGDAYDWIGFDPRGVGSSKPALTCDGSYFSYDRPLYAPITPALEKTWLDRSKAYAQKCDKAGGALLDHLKTTDTVADMDSIRRALGAKQINYYGFSYGTYLGQVYATLHPRQVRRMVLDGNVDPRRVWYAANLDQDIAFDRNIKVYFQWVAKNDNVFHLGKTGQAVEQLFYEQQLALAAKPAGGVIGADEWTDIFLQAGYYVYGWNDVANAFSGWVHNGDWQTLKTMYDDSQPQGPGADNGYAIYDAVQCTDVQWPTSWTKWKNDNWLTFAKAPFETWGNAWYNAPCLYWGAKPGKPVTINGAKAPAILLISETLDAATPYSGSLEVRKLFPKSVLIEGVGGTTHAGSLSGVACTDNTIATYLSTGKLPKRTAGNHSDKQCAPVPPPTAQAPAASRSSALSALNSVASARPRELQSVK